MKYVLRNKQWIINQLGEESLDRIIKSLDHFFDKKLYINDYLSETPDEPYYTLGINDITNENYMIFFCVFEYQCDVLLLAFKDFFKG